MLVALEMGLKYYYEAIEQELSQDVPNLWVSNAFKSVYGTVRRGLAQSIYDRAQTWVSQLGKYDPSSAFGTTRDCLVVNRYHRGLVLVSHPLSN